MQFKAAPPINELRSILSSVVDMTREDRLKAGFSWNTHDFQIDHDSMLSILVVAVALLANATLPSNFAWRDSSNIDVPMTEAQFKTFAIAAATAWLDVYRKSFTIKDQIMASTTPEEIDINSGMQ